MLPRAIARPRLHPARSPVPPAPSNGLQAGGAGGLSAPTKAQHGNSSRYPLFTGRPVHCLRTPVSGIKNAIGLRRHEASQFRFCAVYVRCWFGELSAMPNGYI